MSENAKKPSIRFDGYMNDWEQRKLSSICSMHARIGWQNLRTSEFLESGNYYLVTGTDFEDGRVNWNTCHYVEQERYDQDKKIQIKNGSILITKDGTLGKVAFVEGLDKPATLNAGVFNVEIIDDEIDNKYLFQYLKAPFLMDYVDKKATGGTIKHLNQNILVDFPVWMPNYEEQKLIGVHFQQLDHLITLHQRKYDALVNVKKSMLKKMFPKNGSSVPEIRFRGFTDAWEQRKLGDLYEKNTEKNEDLIGYDKTISIATMTFKDDGNGASDDSLAGYKVLREGDLAFEGHTNKEFRYGRFVLNDVGTGIMSPRFSTLRPLKQMPNAFWKHYIHYEPIMKKILVNSTKAGTMMNELVISEFFEQKILVPSIEEQAKIGEYFSYLDNLITLHQRELEKLRNFKKACLQKMFV